MPLVGSAVDDARHLVDALDEATTVGALGTEAYAGAIGPESKLVTGEHRRHARLAEARGDGREHRPPPRRSAGGRRLDPGRRPVPRLQDHDAARRRELAAGPRSDLLPDLPAAVEAAARRARRERSSSVPGRHDEPLRAALLGRSDTHDVSAALLRRADLVREELHGRGRSTPSSRSCTGPACPGTSSCTTAPAPHLRRRSRPGGRCRARSSAAPGRPRPGSTSTACSPSTSRPWPGSSG